MSEDAEFSLCADCPNKDECSGINTCVGAIFAEEHERRQAYIEAGVCSDCGACSLEEAEGKCKPTEIGCTGDYGCAGEDLWEDEECDPDVNMFGMSPTEELFAGDNMGL